MYGMLPSELESSASEHTTPPTDVKPRMDTGLHISMRLLLSIIAGLLVADAVKAVVVALTIGPVSRPTTWINVMVTLAGALFVTRVVVDNLLYYTERDIKTEKPKYWTRIVLICLDLLSYAACYAIVARMTVTSSAMTLSTGAVRWMITYATFVELSHAIWCCVARFGLKNEDADDRIVRNAWLNAWLCVSLVSFGIGFILSAIMWCHFRPGFAFVTCEMAIWTVLGGLVSTGAYMVVMGKHYIRLRET